MKKLVIFMCLSILFACNEKEARKPIHKSSGSYTKSSIELSKDIITNEETLIEEITSNDTANEYTRSSYGFWYSYNHRNITDSIYPKKGDLVEYEYQIEDLNKNIIYSKSEIGIKNYLVDEEDIITGLRNGIKLMKKGEDITFIFPSHQAYRFTGDHNKIEPNQPLVFKVQINSIQNKN